MAFGHKSISPWWALPIFGAILLLPLRPETCACAPPPTLELSILEMAQRNYFKEHGKFALNMNELEPSTVQPLLDRLDASSFRIEMDALPDRVIIYGTLKAEVPSDLLGIGIWKQNLPNMIMALAKPKQQNSSQDKLVQIKCVGRQNSLTKPNPPTYDGKKFTCPEGYRNTSAHSTD